MPVVRPLAEAHLRDEPRLDPLHVALANRGSFGSTGERRTCRGAAARAASAACRSPRRRTRCRRCRRSAARRRRCTASTSEPNVPGTPPLAARVAGDDELLVVLRLDLQPVARAPALPVDAVARASRSRLRAPARCATSNSASPSSKLSEKATFVDATRRAARAAAPSARAAAGRRAARRRARAGRTRSRRARRFPAAAPRSSCGRTRRAGRPRRRGRRSALFTAFTIAFATSAKRGGQVVAVARDERAVAAADVRERAIAVELHLERPVVAVRDRGLRRSRASAGTSPARARSPRRRAA